MLRKLPIIAVFGQGTPLEAEPAALARAVGALVARLGAHLLTGGGYGVMEAAAEGFVCAPERLGFSIGVIPRRSDGPFDQPNRGRDGRAYPNRFVEIAIMTPLPPRATDWKNTPARNHINVLTADAVIALPGNTGTHNELDMAAAYRGEADCPRQMRRTVLIGPSERFTERHRQLYVYASSLSEAEAHVQRVLAAHGFRPGGYS